AAPYERDWATARVCRRPARVAQRRNVRVLAGCEPLGLDGVPATPRTPAQRTVRTSRARARFCHCGVDLRFRLLVDAVWLGGLWPQTVSSVGDSPRADGADRVRRTAWASCRPCARALVGNAPRLCHRPRLHASSRRPPVAATRD